MKYLLIIRVSHGFAPTADEVADIGASTEAWVQEMDAAGIRLHGHELAPPSDARTVRVRDGKRTVTDGPFAESREFMAGFDLLECRDLDQAIEVGAKHPMARYGTVEVWPFDLAG